MWPSLPHSYLTGQDKDGTNEELTHAAGERAGRRRHRGGAGGQKKEEQNGASMREYMGHVLVLDLMRSTFFFLNWICWAGKGYQITEVHLDVQEEQTCQYHFFFLFDHTTPLLEGVSVHDVWCGMGRGESRVCSGRDIFVCCFFFSERAVYTPFPMQRPGKAK